SSYWSVAGGLQWALLAVAAVGLGWGLVALMMGIGPLIGPKTPSLGPVPIPYVMLFGALALGALLGAVLLPVAERAGQRRSVRFAEQLTSAVDAVAREQLLQPVREVLEEHRATRQVLDQLS
ncbi:MAG: ABC transporter, partial [Angustibacter sp.]